MLPIQELWAPINEFSRPGIKLKKVKGIVLHYTADPDAPAVNIARYFKNLANQNPNDNVADRYAGAHFSLDTKSIYISIPENELGYHVGAKTYKSKALAELSSYPNNCTLGIEMCIDKNGDIPEATFQNAVDLTVYLCKKHSLNVTHLWQHFDITGKLCPLPWIEKPSEWARFKKEVAQGLKPVVKPIVEAVKPVVAAKPAPKPVVAAKKPVAKPVVAAKKPVAKPVTHKVVSGDTLGEIADKYKTTVANLKSFNKLKTDVLQIGQVLRLTKPVAPVAPSTHKVVSGDTLGEIAAKYKTTVAKIKTLNKLKSDVIQLGQVLKVK